LGVNVRVYQTTDHSLILRLMFYRFGLEKIDALLAERQGDLHALLSKRQLFRRWKEIREHLNPTQGLIRVVCFHAHTQPFLCANSQRQLS
jgi:hypothetical protein